MDLFASMMRTLVPAVAGLLGGWAARAGLSIDSATMTAVVTTAATAAYYSAFRLLESWAGRVGWAPLRTAAGVLLGWARPPEYPAATTDAPLGVPPVDPVGR